MYKDRLTLEKPHKCWLYRLPCTITVQPWELDNNRSDDFYGIFKSINDLTKCFKKQEGNDAISIYKRSKNILEQSVDDNEELFGNKYWNKLHLQIIWYGREFCKARDCYGITCKICKSCYPNRKKPFKTKKA